MMVFWLIGAALAVVALALVLRPLLANRAGGPVSRSAANISIYRDQLRELEADLAAGTLAQADYDRARAELEGRLLEDVREQPAAPAARPAGRLAALATVAVIPLVALAVYFAVGSPSAIVREPEQHVSAQQVEAMVGRLAAKLRENPDDIDGWKLLGRSYAALGRFDQAADAFAKATARAPRDPDLLAVELLAARSSSIRTISSRSRSPGPRLSTARNTPRRPATGSACCRTSSPARRTRAPSSKT